MKKLFLILIAVFTSIHSFALKPERTYRIRPENYALIYKDLNVVTSDGLKIKTWFFPAQDSIPTQEFESAIEKPVNKEYKLKYQGKRPTIILCNGDAGNMFYQIQYAKYLVAQGYNVVTFDWRGFGESDDWNTREDYLVYTEYLSDYNSVINEVIKQSEVDSNRIGVYGYSTGAYLSFAIFLQRNEIKSFAGRGLMTSFEDFIKLRSQIQPEKKIICPQDYPNDLMPRNIAPKIEKPVFLIVGENDERTPVWMSNEIFNLLKGEKQLWVVNEATHGGATGPDFKDFDKFLYQLKTFFDLNL